uniref:WD_REPEATS_REGION domain-containing protein n=1 Tax=Gongylonema pulchrum TaxID=637853 RepID=A0A183E294_9BILA
LQTLLLSFDRSSPAVAGTPGIAERLSLVTRITSELNTDPYATMNMDCYCDIYQSHGFSLTELNDNNKRPHLTLNFEHVLRITSDKKPENAYQKTVRFDRSIDGQPQKLYTGGADGCIHGKLCISVGHDAAAHIWDTSNGKQLLSLNVPNEIGGGFRVRSVRFTVLGSTNTIFLATYNQIRRTPKSVSHIALWAYNRERGICRPILVRQACNEQQQFHIPTFPGIEFLPQKTYDFAPLSAESERQRCSYPGVASEYRAAVVSLSADQTVQLHAVPFTQSTSFTSFLLRLSIIAFVFYYII